MKNFFVVGNNTSKSLSPTIFNHWFKKYKIDAHYGFLEIEQLRFDKKIKQIVKDNNIVGLNVTIPFKQKIIKHLDVLDIHAKKINAVNCLSLKPIKKGNNTDWQGYFNTLPKIENYKNKEIILIGYGGAALAIHYLLKKKGFKKINIFNRTKRKIKYVKKIKYTLNLNKLNQYFSSAYIIINTTPFNPINNKDLHLISKKTILSDIVYSPKETNFLKKFPNNKKIYGISMLIEQAIISFDIWFGFKPQVDRKLIKILDKKIK